MITDKNMWTSFFKSFYFEHKPTRRYSGLSVRFVVDRPGFDSNVESYRRPRKQCSLFSSWRSARKRSYEEKAGNFACCFMWKGTQQNTFISIWQAGGEAENFTHHCGPV